MYTMIFIFILIRCPAVSTRLFKLVTTCNFRGLMRELTMRIYMEMKMRIAWF